MPGFQLASVSALLLVASMAIPATASGGVPDCTLLDRSDVRGLMSGMFETRLLHACGRADGLGGWAPSDPTRSASKSLVPRPDSMVNSTSDTGDSTTQSTPSIAVNSDNGVVCAAFDDSFSWASGSHGFAGTARSTDGGATFQDHGVLDDSSFGHTSLVWRRSDGNFYLATLHLNGLGLWVADGLCSSFSFVGMIHTGGGDDRPKMTVDNEPASPYYGRFYTAFTDFSAGGSIYVTLSTNGTSWLTPVQLSTTSDIVQSGWPAVAPNGDVYVAWTRFTAYPEGPLDLQMGRSTDGGLVFARVGSPWKAVGNPRHVGATANCGRPALYADVRHQSSPQVAVGQDGTVHAVFAYDPDGYDHGDVVDVFYRRSINNGVTWQPQVRLNDDLTDTDQWNPTVSVGDDGTVVTSWYDRRLDPTQNHHFDYYKRVSHDGGLSWEPSVRVSDTSSAVWVSNDPVVAFCYHCDRTDQVQDKGRSYLIWSDSRRPYDGRSDPDIWFERDPNSIVIFLDAFESGDVSAWTASVP